MPDHATIHTQLAQLHSSGVEVGLAELLRYQTLTHLFDLSAKSPPRSSMSGGYLSRQKGRGMEFDEVRHYLPGDDIRAIDWRVTARTGKTHTKIYREERDRPVLLVADVSPSMHFGSQLLFKSVQAAHLCALLAWSAVKRGDKVGALLFNDQAHIECKPASRQRAVLHLCRQLIHIHGKPAVASDPRAHGSGFTDACARLRHLARPGSLIYLLSDFSALSALQQPHLRAVARHCEVHAVCLYDPLEQTLPSVGAQRLVAIDDGQKTQQWWLGNPSHTQRFAQWRQQQQQQTQDFFSRNGIFYHRISAASPLEQQLMSAKQVTLR